MINVLNIPSRERTSPQIALPVRPLREIIRKYDSIYLAMHC
jgi:hypothetical protein